MCFTQHNGLVRLTLRQSHQGVRLRAASFPSWTKRRLLRRGWEVNAGIQNMYRNKSLERPTADYMSQCLDRPLSVFDSPYDTIKRCPAGSKLINRCLSTMNCANSVHKFGLCNRVLYARLPTQRSSYAATRSLTPCSSPVRPRQIYMGCSDHGCLRGGSV